MKISKIVVGILMLATAISGCKTKDDTTPEQTVNGEVSGTWAKGSVIQVKSDIIIPVGKSLTIEEGVTVIMDTTVKPEFIVNGNLYVTGTSTNPVKITVPEAARIRPKYQYGGLWGGILASKTCAELLLDNVIMEYGGAVTTEASTSVKLGLYKAAAGEFDPALWVSNVDGKVVMKNSTVRFWKDDATYLEGGNIIFMYNTFYSTGANGGDGINIKSGVKADVAFNLLYSINTNGLKLSNVGERTPQAYVIAYNNTLVNNGWRRPSIKGGSIWVESSVRMESYNNLIANSRFGIKRDTKKPEDTKSIVSNTYYYGYYQDGVDQFQPSKEILTGTNDVISKTAGDNDPKFVNFPLNTDKLTAEYNTAWDFSLQAGSPALGKGITNFTRHFASGLTLNGKTYSSPAPATYAGAFGTK
jgi:hypothetical protein